MARLRWVLTVASLTHRRVAQFAGDAHPFLSDGAARVVVLLAMRAFGEVGEPPVALDQRDGYGQHAQDGHGRLATV